MAPPDAPPLAFPHPQLLRLARLPGSAEPPGHYEELSPGSPGMTLRDFFAAYALIAMAAYLTQPVGVGSVRMTAASCYLVADAMLAARQGEDYQLPTG